MAAGPNPIVVISPKPLAVTPPGPLTAWQDKPFGAAPIDAGGSVIRVVNQAVRTSNTW